MKIETDNGRYARTFYFTAEFFKAGSPGIWSGVDRHTPRTHLDAMDLNNQAFEFAQKLLVIESIDRVSFFDADEEGEGNRILIWVSNPFSWTTGQLEERIKKLIRETYDSADEPYFHIQIGKISIKVPK